MNMESLSPEAYPAVNTDIVRRRLAAVDALDEYLSKDDKVLYEPQTGVMHEIRRFIADNIEDKAWGYVSLPTGSGKTVLFQQLAEATGLRTLVVAPKKRLVEQAQNAFNKFDSQVSTGLLYTHEKTVDTDVVITTGHSLVRHTDPEHGLIKPREFGLLVLDEAHRALGASTQDVIRRHFGHAIAIGFTATKRFDHQRSLDALLPQEIYDMPIAEAVEKKLISPFSNMVLLSEYARMSTVSIRQGEYEPRELNRAINIDPRNLALAEFYEKNLSGQRAIFFLNSIDHSETMAAALREQNVEAVAIHSKLSNQQQQEIYKRFEQPIDEGGLEAICSVRMLTEGFDSPNASVCINVSPTLSLALEQQRSGRVQRLDPNNPGKHALIIDVVDHTDFGKYRPPVIYSHKDIAGTARFLSNGYHPPFDPEKTVPVSGLELMHDPVEVEKLAETLAGISYYERESQEGWYTVKDIVEHSGYSMRTIQLAMEATRQKQPDLFEDPAMTSLSRVQANPIYSLAMAERFIQNAELVNAAPDGWLKASQIAILAGRRERIDLQSQFKNAQAELPEYHVGRFVDEIGQANAVLFFSPKAVNAVLAPLGLSYHPDKPAESWTSLGELEVRYGSEEIHEILYGHWGIMSAKRNQSHKIIFGGKPHLSPTMLKEIDELLSPPEGYRLAGELLEKYGIEAEDLRQIAVWGKYQGYQIAKGYLRRTVHGLNQEFVDGELFESWSELQNKYVAETEPDETNQPTSKAVVPDKESGPSGVDLEGSAEQMAQEPEDEENDEGIGLRMAAEGKVHERFPYWWRKAECSHASADTFFPERGASTRKARNMCTQCKVSGACLVLALEANEKFGVWGGVTERPRRELKKILNLGGTWEDVIEIQQDAMKSPTGISKGGIEKRVEKKLKEMVDDAVYIIQAEDASSVA